MVNSMTFKSENVHKTLTRDFFDQYMVCSVSRYRNPNTKSGYQESIRWLCDDKSVTKWFNKKRETEKKFDEYYSFIGNIISDFLLSTKGSSWTGTYYQNCKLLTSICMNECFDDLNQSRSCQYQ